MKEHLGTRTVHGGEQRPRPHGAVTTPIVQTSTYTFEDTNEILRFIEEKEAKTAGRRHEYGRYSNPTMAVAEARIADLEGAESCLLFASGMSAITTVLMTYLSSGDHLIVASHTYRQTRTFIHDILSRWQITATFLPDGAIEDLEPAIRPETRLILCEAPTNPTLRVIDLDRVTEIARRNRILTVLDATFATPVNLRAGEHGVDLCIHSATKYLGGHNDLLAGAVTGARETLSSIESTRGILGGVGSPHDAYLLIRGLKTLDLRVKRQNASGQRIAEFLDQHPAVDTVHYPGLPTHPDHVVARRLMDGYGGVVSFEVRGGCEAAGRVIDALRIPQIGPTLGGVESMVQQQAIFISSDPEHRRRSGIPEGLIRYAVGVEDVDDLIADLEQALGSSGIEGRAVE